MLLIAYNPDGSGDSQSGGDVELLRLLQIRFTQDQRAEQAALQRRHGHREEPQILSRNKIKLRQGQIRF